MSGSRLSNRLNSLRYQPETDDPRQRPRERRPNARRVMPRSRLRSLSGSRRDQGSNAKQSLLDNRRPAQLLHPRADRSRPAFPRHAAQALHLAHSRAGDCWRYVDAVRRSNAVCGAGPSRLRRQLCDHHCAGLPDSIGYDPIAIGIVLTASLLGTAIFTLAIGAIAPRHIPYSLLCCKLLGFSLLQRQHLPIF
jgi:hypothetical protein